MTRKGPEISVSLTVTQAAAATFDFAPAGADALMVEVFRTSGSDETLQTCDIYGSVNTTGNFVKLNSTALALTAGITGQTITTTRAAAGLSVIQPVSTVFYGIPGNWERLRLSVQTTVADTAMTFVITPCYLQNPSIGW